MSSIYAMRNNNNGNKNDQINNELNNNCVLMMRFMMNTNDKW